MRERITLELARDAQIVRDAVTGLPVLRYRDAVVPLNEAAARLLRLCDGRRTRAELVKGSNRVRAFLEGVERLKWITKRLAAPGRRH